MKNISAKELTDWHNGSKVFVCYRLPNTKTTQILYQKNQNIYYDHCLNNDGFIMAPFNSSTPNIIIPSEHSLRLILDTNQTENKLPNHVTTDDNPIDKSKHINLINQTIAYIKSNKADKIVISRPNTLSLNTSIVELYLNLLNHYPEAMVYLWHHPKIGIWIGATPEKLIALKHKYFTTMALAGTQVYNKNLKWHTKEIEEQEFVTNYIRTQITDLCTTLNISKVYTKKAGHLAHLCTDFLGTIKNETTLQQLVNKLHPTPAVCGVPIKNAKEFINTNEGYDRSFYTGYLGVIENNNLSQLFVNLRCMSLKNNTATLYIGGGITDKSDANKEWGETTEKAKTLARFLN